MKLTELKKAIAKAEKEGATEFMICACAEEARFEKSNSELVSRLYFTECARSVREGGL